MNSGVLPRLGLTGTRVVKPPQESGHPKNPLTRKQLISAGVGLALSLGFIWVQLNKGPAAVTSTKIIVRPDQAIYQWIGFHRMALPLPANP